ncbi:hypothetical protein LCM4579_09910 [Ensifer sp. LCM 4579]|nr:hypothetical protein LCM4579_09910 [Ensifer sp. LCM 4579]
MHDREGRLPAALRVSARSLTSRETWANLLERDQGSRKAFSTCVPLRLFGPAIEIGKVPNLAAMTGGPRILQQCDPLWEWGSREESP